MINGWLSRILDKYKEKTNELTLSQYMFGQTLDDSFQRSAGGGQSCPFVNDLEPVTVSRYPVVGELKAEMAGLGAEPALMSGSGATVFGLFADREQAKRAFLHFQGIYAHTYLTRPLSG